MPMLSDPISTNFDRWVIMTKSVKQYMEAMLALPKTEHVCYAISENVRVHIGVDWIGAIELISQATLNALGKSEYDDNQYNLADDVANFKLQMTSLKTVVDQYAVSGSSTPLTAPQSLEVNTAIQAVLDTYV